MMTKPHSAIVPNAILLITLLATPTLTQGQNAGSTASAAEIALKRQANNNEQADAASNGSTYFVDSKSGQDNADGQAAERAWRSLDRVNAAELKPGDIVRFKRGGLWRGSLVPCSGNSSMPVTYTSFGNGPKPLILGSRPRNLPTDWQHIEGNVWGTQPLKYQLGATVSDLRSSEWRHHQEAGAHLAVSKKDTDEGRTIRLECESSGSASNHVQVWGPALPVERGDFLVMTFRARSSIPFQAPPMSIRQSSSPWTSFATADPSDQTIGVQWGDFQAVFTATGSSANGHLHMSLGSVLPPGAVLEFRPLNVRAATPNTTDPLSVDVGNIIFDHGKVCGWKKWSLEQLEQPYDYFYDGPAQRVYLYCDANPATRHKSIECALKRHVVSQGGKHHVIYDGLAIKYGAAHGFGGGSTHHLVIRNCDLSYIGGAHQLTTPNGVPVRYGNAIEFWGAASNHLVENCRIWEVYDAALTNQNKTATVRQENIVYRNNLIWNCEYSFEYWNRPETSVTKNIRFVNNTCIDAGDVWSHAQRPSPNGSHLMFYTNSAATSGFEVKYNIFFNATDWGCRYTSEWKTLPDLHHNVWYSDKGVMAHWFGKKIGTFQDYQQTTGLDHQSLFADPRFLDLDHQDFRLAPNSPARKIRPDGGPVGVESLWK